MVPEINGTGSFCWRRVQLFPPSLMTIKLVMLFFVIFNIAWGTEDIPTANNVLSPNSKMTIGDGGNLTSRTRIAQIREALRGHPSENILGIIIFGSVAKGTAREDSDLDYLLIRERGFSPFMSEQDDEEFYSFLRKNFPFIEHPPITSLIMHGQLDAREFQAFDMTLAFYFMPPRIMGIKVYGARTPGASMITDWLVVSYTNEEERKLTKFILDRMKIVRTLSNKRGGLIRSLRPFLKEWWDTITTGALQRSL